MKTTKKQASVRLFKKLSALRATLSNEEREILDGILVTNEVSAHKMAGRTVSKAVTKTAGKIASGKIAGKFAEVEAHKMADKTVSKAVTKAAGKIASGKIAGKFAEVEAHKMADRAVSKAVTKATPKIANKAGFRISFDENSEEYKIQE